MTVNKKIIFKNSIFLLTRTIVVTLVSLFTLRELLRILGVNAFGLFNLVFGIAILFTFLNGALIVSIQRYLGVKVGEGDINGVSKVFASSCLIHIFIGFFISFVMIVFKDFILHVMLKVDDTSVNTNLLYIIAIINTFLVCLQSPFIALINIFEKMKFIAYMGILEVILKLIFVYVLEIVSGSRIINYAIMMSLITFFILVLYIYYCIKSFKEIFSILSFRGIGGDVKRISSFMGWTLIGNFTWMSRVQGTNILLNMFFGLAANAAYAIFNNIFNAINNLLNAVTNAIKPQIFISFSKGDIDNFNNLIYYGSKFFTFGVAALIFPIIFTCDRILEIWLGFLPPYSVVFVQLGLIFLLIESLSIFITIGVQAIGKIKLYQICLGLMLIINLPIIYFLFNNNYIINSFMYVLIVNSLICYFIRLSFLTRYIDFNAKKFISEVFFKTLLVSILISILNYLIFKMIIINDIYSLLITLFLLFFLNIMIIYIFGLEKRDRLKIRIYLKAKFS